MYWSLFLVFVGLFFDFWSVLQWLSDGFDGLRGRFLKNFAWCLVWQELGIFFHATYFCQLFSDGKILAKLITLARCFEKENV